MAWPHLNSAQEEARFFIDIAGDYISKGYLRPVLDIEKGEEIGQEALSNWIHTWMEIVKDETGVEPILYVDSNFANNYLDSSINRYDLWIAHWRYNPELSPNIGIWNDWQFWQYSEQGIVPGITGNVDLDVFNGTELELNQYLIDAIPGTLAALINQNALSIEPVTVDGNSYSIVTLTQYIDPVTQQPTGEPTTNKVFIDSLGNPVTDPEIARKIGVISIARTLQDKHIFSNLSYDIENIQDRLTTHGAIKCLSILSDSLAKSLGYAVRAYGSAGAEILFDVINDANKYAQDLISDPMLIVESMACLDLTEAQVDFQQAIDIDKVGIIDDYATAEECLHHLFAGWEKTNAAFKMLNSIDGLGKSTFDTILDFTFTAIRTFLKGTVTDIIGSLTDSIDLLNTIPEVSEYTSAIYNLDSVIETRLADMGNGIHTLYTLALAQGIQEQEPDITFLPPYSQIDRTIVSAGQKFLITYSIHNKGTAVDSFYTRISLDISEPYGTTVFLKNIETQPLAQSVIRDYSEWVDIPCTMTPGTYYVTVYADVFKEIDECDEGNNIASISPVKLTVAAAPEIDLVPVGITCPASARHNDTFSLDLLVENTGNTPSGSFTSRIFLSQDQSSTSIPVATVSMSSINGNSQNTIPVQVTIPSETPTGDYYLVTYADSNREIQETDENNNVTASVGTITIEPQETLIPVIARTPTSIIFEVMEGTENQVDQSLTIWNSGDGTLDWSISEDAGWLSVTPLSGTSTGDSTDVTVSVTVSGLNAGTYSASITISDINASNNPQTVPVSLVVLAQDTTISIHGEIREVNGDILPGVTVSLNGEVSATSNPDGSYELIFNSKGTFIVTATKSSYRSQSQTVTITDLTDTYTLDFKGIEGLIPNAPDLSYVLACINKWQFPPVDLGLDISKVLAVINAWKYPTQ